MGEITMTQCWLYIFENAKQKKVYIGIGDSLGRIFGKHNADADALREESTTMILQTVEPFSSRTDARKAEAAAIHVASFAGMEVVLDDESPEIVTNRAGVVSTRELGPAIALRDGEVKADELGDAVFVSISAAEMDVRPTPFGGREAASFATRAQKYWNISAAKRPGVRHMVALLKGSGNVILGSWRVDPEQRWESIPDWESLDLPYRTRVVIPLVDPNEDNFRDIKGKRLVGLRANSGPVYGNSLS